MTEDESAKRQEEVIRLYEVDKLSIRQIAKHLDVKPQAVHHRLAKAGISMRPQGLPGKPLPPTVNRDNLHELYNVQRMPVYKLAETLGIYPKQAASELEKHGIKQRPRCSHFRNESVMDGLEVGESALMPLDRPDVPFSTIYAAASTRKIRVSISRVDDGNVRIKRVG